MPSSNQSAPDDAKVIEQEARAWFSQAGVLIVEPGGADPGNTHHLRLDVQTLRTRDDIFCYNLLGRCSLLSDQKLTENEPGNPQRIWFAHRIAGQKGEAGFQGSLIKALRQILGNLFIDPTAPSSREEPGKAPQGTENLETVADDTLKKKVLDVTFSQIKIRNQPPAPPYPTRAKEQGIQGTVVVEITIDPTGMPIRVEALSGPGELLMTAIRYALKWEFEPARLNGIPQAARFKLTMPFALRERHLPPSPKLGR
jgi:TonB family protein